jgi:Cdc6-like AAA superfamily ATPase
MAEAAEATVASTDEERIAFILDDKRFWVPYPEANEAMRLMKEMRAAPRETRPLNLAIIGPPSSGKSQLLRVFAERNIPPYDPNEDDPTLPVLRIDMPEAPEQAAFVRELLAGIGAHYSSREPVDELVRRLTVFSMSLGIELFAVDEFHNGFKGTKRQQDILLNLTRGISSRTGVPIAIAGIDKVENFLKADPQLSTRFRRLHLPVWKENEALLMFLKTFEQKLGLKERSQLGTTRMRTLILKLTGGATGQISRLLRTSGVVAIRQRTEKITDVILEDRARYLPRET